MSEMRYLMVLLNYTSVYFTLSAAKLPPQFMVDHVSLTPCSAKLRNAAYILQMDVHILI